MARADHPSIAKASRGALIQLTNGSSSILKNPKVYTLRGYCSTLLNSIRVGETETIAFVNTKGVLCGAVGVMTYDITADEKSEDMRLAIMFSVPFDYNIFENWFAFGLFSTHQACNYSLYKLMNYDDGPFERGKGSGSEIKFSTNGYALSGKMSPAAKAQIEVELRSVEQDMKKQKTEKKKKKIGSHKYSI